APEMQIPNLQFYEHLVRAEDDDLVWPIFDERTASSLCYTSGTTGNPKGVLYSHRSTILHAYGSALPDSLSLSSNDCVLPVVPMFHVNAWGIPYAAPMTGAKLVFPGAKLDGASLSELYEAEGVTATSGVPTVWLGLLNHWKANDIKPRSLKKVVIGGSAAPKAMIESFEKEYGCHVLHAWGMTELSPLGTVNAPKFKHQNHSIDEKIALQAKQGRPVYGIDLRIVNDEGKVLPHDGKAFGELQVRGAWVCSQYYQREVGSEHTVDGWFSTGDVVTIDPDGYMQITDRSKDVIKSGGEWISSIDLENVMMAHPAVAEAAVIGIKHPKWDERPLLIIVKKPGAELSKQEALEFYEGKIAKWWLPNDVVFVNELPHTATGKIQKLKLREQFKDFQFSE
ncbi:MAG TPA: AMP-binding protein, partial [Pseudomonadales bacterium]|nr:AMP-binding protein [Pseudomonadales bacterium]